MNRAPGRPMKYAPFTEGLNDQTLHSVSALIQNALSKGLFNELPIPLIPDSDSDLNPDTLVI